MADKPSQEYGPWIKEHGCNYCKSQPDIVWCPGCRDRWVEDTWQSETTIVDIGVGCHMDKIYQRCWVSLKDYIRSKNSHGKNEILEKMIHLEVIYTLKDITGEFPVGFKNDLGDVRYEDLQKRGHIKRSREEE